MREIKFRVWNTDYKDPIMEYFDPRKESSKLNRNYLYKFSDKDWMQYTGLKDKNGKEIYEGDIVAIQNKGRVITVCKKCPGYFTLIDRADGEWTRQFFHQPERLTVIGNIHESPELLNSEEEETGK